ncbi:carboxymuconolactone decarboxylase family protein [Pseudomonas batumici]|uniref:carboxymuconolactone decarboxylase family protein n=1 Tax=Pseudomonas batumici TaxID=226910 RepID=UPI0030CEA058
MFNFEIYTLESAPVHSKPVLETLQQAFGFIPNIAGAMAGSPTLINSFIGVFQHVHSGSFTEDQIQTLLLTNAVTNASSWPVAFHTFLALKEGLNPADVEAIRAGHAPKNVKHAALSGLAKSLIESRGHVSDQALQAFFDAGFKKEQVLELINVVAASTITNYVASVTNPPLEESFQAYGWNK